jgi:hypothetical protein
MDLAAFAHDRWNLQRDKKVIANGRTETETNELSQNSSSPNTRHAIWGASSCLDGPNVAQGTEFGRILDWDTENQPSAHQREALKTSRRGRVVGPVPQVSNRPPANAVPLTGKNKETFND